MRLYARIILIPLSAAVSVALIAAGMPTPAFRWFVGSDWLMCAGTPLISGNPYLRSLAHFNDWHALKSFGGGAFILAGIALMLGALTARDGGRIP